MKDYIKPTFHIALATGSRAASSCDIISEDRDLLLTIIGGADKDQVFGGNEPCTIPIDYEGFCKFTSAELGAAQVFWS